MVVISLFVAVILWSQVGADTAMTMEISLDSARMLYKNQFNRFRLGGFCGTSSDESCKSDEGCGLGCHSECVAKKEGRFKGDLYLGLCTQDIDLRKCIREEKYNVECGCNKSKCQWTKK